MREFIKDIHPDLSVVLREVSTFEDSGEMYASIVVHIVSLVSSDVWEGKVRVSFEDISAWKPQKQPRTAPLSTRRKHALKENVLKEFSSEDDETKEGSCQILLSGKLITAYEDEMFMMNLGNPIVSL